MFYRRLLFCGGGVRVIGHVGALEVIKDHIKFVNEFCGVSAGALLAMCLAVGYTLEELREFIIGFDFTNVMDAASAPELLQNFGLDTGARLQKMTEACIRVKGLSGEITFKELSKGLRVYATDLNTGMFVIFSKELTPNARVADAVRASMSFPYYFQPYVDPESGHKYGDGGIISNFPMFTFTESERAQTLGFLFEESCAEIEDLDFGESLMRPFMINIQARARADVRAYGKWSIVTDISGINPLDFELDQETKKKLLDKGATAAKEWLARQYKPIRRFSCY
jgi:predicted acylesterase/phospholipase RssA